MRGGRNRRRVDGAAERRAGLWAGTGDCWLASRTSARGSAHLFYGGSPLVAIDEPVADCETPCIAFGCSIPNEHHGGQTANEYARSLQQRLSSPWVRKPGFSVESLHRILSRKLPLVVLEADRCTLWAEIECFGGTAEGTEPLTMGQRSSSDATKAPARATQGRSPLQQ